MPRSVELFTSRRSVTDPADGRSFGPFDDAEYHPIGAEVYAGVNALSQRREACAEATHRVEVPDGAGLVVEVLEGRPSAWEVAGPARRRVDADELLRLAREGWRGLRLAPAGREAAEDLERFTLAAGGVR